MSDANDRLIRALAEQLKLPLLQIARQAELSIETNDTSTLLTISHIADNALRLVDGFLLSTDRKGDQLYELTPVSMSSALQDTAHKLYPIAKQNNCELEVSLSGRYGPVMAHKQGLESALLLIGYSMIESRTFSKPRHQVVLAAHRSTNGLVGGVFDNQPGLSMDMLRRGKALFGNVRQPLPTVSGANGAGVFIADTLLNAMEAPLRVARHDKLTGLAATFHPSSQLSLV